MDRFHSLAGSGCRAREDTQEVAPSGVVKACVETGFAAGPLVLRGAVLILLRRGTTAQVGRLDRLVRDRVVLADQRQGGLVVKVRALPADMLMLLGEHQHRFLAPVTPLHSLGNALLGLLQLALGCTVVSRAIHVL